MRKQETFSPAAVGGSSLLVIFAVLCLTVFALLSLSSVQAERRLADAATQSVVDYYQADLRAEEIFARLRDGEQIAGIEEPSSRDEGLRLLHGLATSLATSLQTPQEA